MPTVFTHALVGASLAGLAPGAARPVRLAAALAVASMLPDADVVAFWLGIPYEHALGHRGLSHSLAFAAVVGAALAMAWRWRAPPGVAHRAGLAALFVAAIASHGLLDTLTDGGLGVGLLLPFDEARYFAHWRPVRVSPIGVQGFLAGDASGVLGSELRVIGLPALALAGVLALARGGLARRGSRGSGRA